MATPAPIGEGFSRPNEVPPEARDGETGDRGLGVSTFLFSRTCALMLMQEFRSRVWL